MTTYAITEGQFCGWLLRARGERVEARGDGPTGRWSTAPLRLLTKYYAADSPVWDWLRAHGARRQSPSGPSGASTPRARRARRDVSVTLSDEAHARLDELAHARGVSRSGLVDDLILKMK